jgi:hypothetical protein
MGTNHGGSVLTLRLSRQLTRNTALKLSSELIGCLAFYLKVGLSGIVITALVLVLANQPTAIRLSGLLLGLVSC